MILLVWEFVVFCVFKSFGNFECWKIVKGKFFYKFFNVDKVLEYGLIL